MHIFIKIIFQDTVQMLMSRVWLEMKRKYTSSAQAKIVLFFHFIAYKTYLMILIRPFAVCLMDALLRRMKMQCIRLMKLKLVSDYNAFFVFVFSLGSGCLVSRTR